MSLRVERPLERDELWRVKKKFEQPWVYLYFHEATNSLFLRAVRKTENRRSWNYEWIETLENIIVSDRRIRIVRFVLVLCLCVKFTKLDRLISGSVERESLNVNYFQNEPCKSSMRIWIRSLRAKTSAQESSAQSVPTRTTTLRINSSSEVPGRSFDLIQSTNLYSFINSK